MCDKPWCTCPEYYGLKDEPDAALAERDALKQKDADSEAHCKLLESTLVSADATIDALRDELAQERAAADRLAEALRTEVGGRQAMLEAVGNLSRTVAPILAAFRGDPKNPGPDTGGTLTEDQIDAAIEAMGAVQMAETAHAADLFQRVAALSAHDARRQPATEGGER